MLYSSNNENVSSLERITNKDIPIDISKINMEHYLFIQKIISQLFLIPFILYILLLSFILHLSIFNPLSHRTINQKLSEKKKYLILLLIFTYLFRFCQYIFNYVYDNGSVCVFLSCYNIIAVFALILTIFLITEQNTKIIKLPYKNPVLFFFIINDISFIMSLLNEIYHNLFDKTFSFIVLNCAIGTYTVILFYKKPNNEYTSMLSTNITYVELQEIRKNISSKKTLNKISESFKSIKEQFLEKEDNEPVCNRNALPTITISFKNSFNIKVIDENNSENNFVDFYTSIFFNFVVIVSSNFYDSKNLVRRSLKDFIELEVTLSNEFNEENYQKNLVDTLPALNINKEIIKNSIEVIPQIKEKAENFLLSIIKEPAFINKEVLTFLDIHDSSIEDSFNINRKQYIITIKKKINMYNSLTRNLSMKKIEKTVNTRNKIKIIEGSYQKIKPFKKVYMLSFRLSCENAYKIVKKSIDDTNMLLYELSHIKYSNIYSGLNAQALAKEALALKVKFTEKIDNYFMFKHNNNYNLSQYIILVETILQSVINNYEEYSRCHSDLIKDYFNDFKEDFTFNKKKKKYFLPSFKRQNSSQSNSSTKFETLLQENLISNIEIVANNYVYIAIDFHCKIFYEICFKIVSLYQDFVEINKKYKFKEIKSYIDLMKTDLGMDLQWPNQCYITDKDDLERKYKIRLDYIDKYLHEIVNNNKFFKSQYWKNVFYMDTTYNSIEKESDKSIGSDSFRQDSLYIDLIS